MKTIHVSQLVANKRYRFILGNDIKAQYGFFKPQPKNCCGEGWPVFRNKILSNGHTDTPLRVNDVQVYVKGELHKITTHKI